MQAGKLRHRLEVQRGVETQNDLGEAVTRWQSVDKRWAEIRPLSGTELFKARQVQGDVTHEVHMRWYKGLTPAFRLKYGERVFEILSAIDVEERHRETLCICKEHVVNA